MLNIFYNLRNSDNTLNKQTTFSLLTCLNFYKLFYSMFNINFFKYTELVFIFKKFKSVNSNIFLTIFIYFFNSQKLNPNNVKFFSIINNSSLIYFFNQTNSILNKLVLPLKINLISSIKNTINSNYVIRYSPTNVSKYLHSNYLNLLNVLFLRKNKVFNKGRYSRNRQFYRTGVYWCLYINIIAIVGLYFWFYRFVMNFGYLWWLLYLSLASFVLAKSFNYNLLNYRNLILSIKLDFLFFSTLILNLFNFLFNFFSSLIKKLNNYNFIFNILLNSYVKFSGWFLFGLISFFKKSPYIYLWGYNNENYYIYSITQNFNRVLLDSKKNKFFSEFVNMILKR